MFFNNQSETCDYFPKGLENFAVLLKGSSLEKVVGYHDKFNHCFIVSDFDDELGIIGGYLIDKNVAHFTNRSRQSSLTKRSYQKYNINTVQTGQAFSWKHFRLIETYCYYKSLFIGLNIYSLPKHLMNLNGTFGKEYSTKFPNTGILSLAYTLEMIRPKCLWVFGLDFYETPYMATQTQSTQLTLGQQSGKLQRLDLPNFVFRLFRSYNDVEIMMASHYTKWPKIPNMQLI